MVYSNSSNVDNSSTNTNTTAITPTNENNMAVIKHDQGEDGWQNKSSVDGSTTAKTLPSSSVTAVPLSSTEDEIWVCTWTVWMRIATTATTIPVSEHSIDSPLMAGSSSNNSSSTAEEHHRREYQQYSQQSLQHKQQFLTALLQIFPLIFNRIKTRFVKEILFFLNIY